MSNGTVNSEFYFENLDVYKLSIALTQRVYTITKGWPREYLFGLTSQFTRAVLSIPLNIAEGSGRTKKDFARFLDISRTSCFECIPIIEIAKFEGLLSDIEYKEIKTELIKLSRMLNRLKASLSHNS